MIKISFYTVDIIKKVTWPYDLSEEQVETDSLLALNVYLHVLLIMTIITYCRKETFPTKY